MHRANCPHYRHQRWPVPKVGIVKGKEKAMNWDQIEGKWKQFQGDVRSKWGKLTDDDLETINGKRDKLVGRLQERYGIKRDQAEKDVDQWIESR